jgi:perosamine synthetase
MFSEIIDAIRQCQDIPAGMVPLHEPRFWGNEKKYLCDTIDTTYVSTVGAYVNRFEEMMCRITGSRYAVAVVNGTAAIHIALLVAGVQPGHEVLTQPLTFIATSNGIVHAGAIPHYVDVDADTLGMSPEALRLRLHEVAEIKDGICYNKITGNKITACLPMHTFGLCCRITEIAAVCKEYNIVLIEDAAESLGSYNGTVHTGNTGLLGTFSFNGNKTVTSGGGGAIITNDEATAKLAKHITTTAKVPHRWEFNHDRVGYNYRMPNLNAALACAQLEQLPFFLEKKQLLAQQYLQYFAGTPYKMMAALPGTTSNYWLCALLLSSREEKEAFLLATNDAQIQTRPVWTLMHHLQMFKDCPRGDVKNAELMASRLVNIPSSVPLRYAPQN